MARNKKTEIELPEVSVSDDGMSESEFDDSDTEPDVERSDPSEKGPPLKGARLDYVDQEKWC